MMDKRTIWIVLACVIALIGWQKLVDVLYPPKPKPPRPPITAPTNVVSSEVETVATNVAAAIQPTPAEPEQPRPPEQIKTLSNEFVRMEFTSWGGGVRLVELLKHKANGHGNIVLNGPGLVPALALLNVPGAGTNDAFQIEQPDAKTIVVRTVTRSGSEIRKTFALGADYTLTGRVEISGRAESTPSTQNVALVVGTATIATAKEGPTFLGVDWYAAGKCQDRNVKVVQKNATKGQNSEPVDAAWAAVKNQFFTMVLTPATNGIAVRYEAVQLPRPADWKTKESPQGLAASLELRPSSTAGGVERCDFAFYAGPKEYDRLAALGKHQEEVMQFGFWGVISVALLKSMKFFYKLVPSYGVAIIIITILIKLLFWPIQAKSIRSMKEMQKFQPLMNKLKEKYKDDPQRMNQEMMKLYKEHKVNPFGGCLPMLVQIPVFFGLFAMLRSAIELRGAPFLWIKDLSLPDTIFVIPGLGGIPFFGVPGQGLPVNPLPLLMTGATIWQQKLTPTTADPQQAKMMMFMPLFMLVIFYNYSSGLALYWTVQQLLSIAQQWWSLRQTGATPAAVAINAGKTK
jgi:YidC/Oxa1 family membrane protein insertase